MEDLLLIQTLKTISDHSLGLSTSWVQLNVSAGDVLGELFASHLVKWRNEAQHRDRTQTLSSYGVLEYELQYAFLNRTQSSRNFSEYGPYTLANG